MNILIAIILLSQTEPQEQPADRGPELGTWRHRPQSEPQQGPATPQPPPQERLWGVEPRITFWWPNLNGRLNVDQQTGLAPEVNGSSISLDRDLDVDDEVPFGVWELGFVEIGSRMGRPATQDLMTLSFWLNEWSGETRLGGEETFDGVTFAAGEEVSSDFRVWCLGLDVNAQGFDFGEGEGMVEGTGGVRVVEIDARLSGTGKDADERTRLLYLGGGFRGRWNASGFFFTGLSGGLYFSFGAYDQTLDWSRGEDWWAILFEGAASVGFETGRVRAEIGLRLTANGVENTREDDETSEDNHFSWLAGGPFAQVAVRF